MKEEEAKTKACPFLSDGIFDTMGLNNVSSDYLARKGCIASDCMMWQWEYSIYIQDGNDCVEKTGGHCGLAHG